MRRPPVRRQWALAARAASLALALVLVCGCLSPLSEPGSIGSSDVPAAGISSVEDDPWSLPPPRELPAEVVWHEGGVPTDLAVEGSVGFLGRGLRLEVYDMAAEAGPTAIGLSEILPDVVRAVAVDGDRAFVAAGSVLFLVDVADPHHPSVVASLAVVPNDVASIVVAEGVVYILSSGLVGPSLVRAVPLSEDSDSDAWEVEISEPATALCLDGGSLFLVASREAAAPGVWLIDVSTGGAPAGAMRVYPSPDARYAWASSGRLYVSETSRFAVMDTSEPTEPVELGWMPVESPPGPVRVEGSRAYLLAGGALRVIEVSDPRRPRQLGFHPVASSAYDLEIGAGNASVLAHVDYSPASRLQSFDVAGPADPVPLGRAVLLAGAHQAVLDDERLYVASDGLRVFDLADAAAPQLVAHVGPQHTFDSFDVDEGLLVALRGELWVVDVAAPEGPQVLAVVEGYSSPTGSVHTIGRPEAHIAVRGRQALLSDGHVVRLISLDDPSEPAVVSELPPPGPYPGVGEDLTEPGEVAFSGDYAVATVDPLPTGGLVTLDIIPASQPLIAARLRAPEPASALGLLCREDVCYVATTGAGLWLVDVSDPEDPVERSAVPGRGRVDAAGICVRDDVAYLSLMPYVDLTPSFGQGGIRVVSVSDPERPVERGIVRTPGYPFDVAVAGRYAYVADGPAGLLVLDLGKPD